MSGRPRLLRQGTAWRALQATAMLGVPGHVRKRAGGMAPAQSDWLKLMERRFWHALHSLGMHHPDVEALGLQAEAVAMKPPTPSSKEACHVA